MSQQECIHYVDPIPLPMKLPALNSLKSYSVQTLAILKEQENQTVTVTMNHHAPHLEREGPINFFLVSLRAPVIRNTKVPPALTQLLKANTTKLPRRRGTKLLMLRGQ
jgi:hypothetical protein